MIRINRLVYLFVLLFAVGTALVAVVNGDEPTRKEEVSYTLVQREYPDANRDTYWLDVQCERAEWEVLATCDLRVNKQGVGRFPLRPLETGQIEGRQEVEGEATKVMRFSISCVAREFRKDSVIHVLIREKRSGKTITGARIDLEDARIGESIE